MSSPNEFDKNLGFRFNFLEPSNEITKVEPTTKNDSGLEVNVDRSFGTAVADFVVVPEYDGHINSYWYFQSITAMPTYKSYSFEELRLQDYAHGRKFQFGATFSESNFSNPSGLNCFESPTLLNCALLPNPNALVSTFPTKLVGYKGLRLTPESEKSDLKLEPFTSDKTIIQPIEHPCPDPTAHRPQPPITYPPAPHPIYCSPFPYYTLPPLDQLKLRSRQDLRKIEGFTVGRVGCGQIRFRQPVDLSDVVLDDLLGVLVQIEARRVMVYPDESQKPPKGTQLNVSAMVRLEKCFSIDKNTGAFIKDPNHPRFRTFKEKLKRQPDVEFIHYDDMTGDWLFIVDSF